MRYQFRWLFLGGSTSWVGSFAPTYLVYFDSLRRCSLAGPISRKAAKLVSGYVLTLWNTVFVGQYPMC